jgi:hypothetical protein
MEAVADLWRWTPIGLEHHLALALGQTDAEVEVIGLGNGLASRAFLFGLVAEDLDRAALAVDDPIRPFVVAAKVRLAE